MVRMVGPAERVTPEPGELYADLFNAHGQLVLQPVIRFIRSDKIIVVYAFRPLELLGEKTDLDRAPARRRFGLRERALLGAALSHLKRAAADVDHAPCETEHFGNA